MKKGSSINLYQSELTQLCLDLFPPSGEFKAPVNNLVQFLNKAPLQELDFNSLIKEDKTPLSIIVEAALKGLSVPLKIILKEVDDSKLDFNIKCQNGTLLRRAALAFYKHKQGALQLILDAVDIKKLNLNAKPDKNYNNVLHLIMLMASQGNMKPLQTILNKPDLSCLDFNSKSSEGETPLWRLALFLSRKQIDSNTVENVFAKLDIMQLDFNFNFKIDDQSFSVLSLLISAAAHGRVKPLQMILKKEVISKFAFHEEEEKGILLGLIIIAFNGYLEPLKILLSTKLAPHWHIDEKVKEALFQSSTENINEILIKMIVNKQSILNLNEVLWACIALGHTDIALTCIQADADEKMFTLPLIDAIANDHHDTVQKIFPYYELYGFPILTKENKSYFDSSIKIKEFLSNPCTYLHSHGLFRQEILNHFQSKLIEFCEDLFSSEGAFDKDLADIFYQFLNEIPLDQLDFNRKLKKGPFKGNTLLWVIALAETTPLWWHASGTEKHKNPIPLQLILDSNSNISACHLNAKSTSNITVFYMAVQAAANRMVGPLETILKKMRVEDLDFDSKPSWRTSIPFLLVLVAMAGYPELIRKILLQRSLGSQWFDEHTNKIIFEKSQEEISACFINKIKNKKINNINENEMLLENLIRFGHTKAALACLEKTTDRSALNTALYDAHISGYQETVKEIFPYYELYGVPISRIITSEFSFTPENIGRFLESDDQLSLVSPFCSKQTFIALNLLSCEYDLKNYKSYLFNELLINYFKDIILDVFENKLKSLKTVEEKKALYRALTELTRDNAEKVIMAPEGYNEEWVELRDEFINELRAISEIKIKTFKVPIVPKDEMLIELILKDPAGEEKIRIALSNCFNNYTDRIQTDKVLTDSKPLPIANPFDGEVSDLLNSTNNVYNWKTTMASLNRQDRFNRYCPRVQEVFKGCNDMPGDFLSHFIKALVLYVDLNEKWYVKEFKSEFTSGKLEGFNEADSSFLKKNLNLLDTLEKLESMNFVPQVDEKKYTPSFFDYSMVDKKKRKVIYIPDTVKRNVPS